MNQDRQRALEAFTRNKTRPPNSETRSALSKWALGISGLSLLISALGLFLSSFLQRDHISLIAVDLPSAFRKPDGSVTLVFAYGDPKIIFINSGNRPAAITSFGASAKLLDHAKPKPEQCPRTDDFHTLPVGLLSIVVKPGEMLSAPVEVFPKKHADGTMDIPKDLFTARLGDELMVCLDLDVATADNVVTRVGTH
jgi:hypothetical protein